MTLKRLMILLAVLVSLAGGGIALLWPYAYSPQGRARVIISQLKGDTVSLRGRMLQHHMLRPGYSVAWGQPEEFAAEAEMVKLGRSVLPVAIEALRNENRPVRAMAARACGKFRDPLAIQPLAQCLHDETRDFNLQHLYLLSLVQIGPEAYGPLLEAAKACKEEVRFAIPRTVAGTWGAEALPQLIGFLDNPDSYVRWSAAYELGGLKDSRATGALIRRLDDGDTNVASYSATALGEIGDPAAIPPLLKLLRDARVENGVRIAAAGALARMGRADGRKYLLEMAQSPKTLDRAQAAETLGTGKIKGATDPLLSLLADRDAAVRLQAVQAIAKFSDPRVIPAVKKLLNDPDSDVRQSAADALKKLHASASMPAKSWRRDTFVVPVRVLEETPQGATTSHIFI
jgi:HEAT repeat protein